MLRRVATRCFTRRYTGSNVAEMTISNRRAHHGRLNYLIRTECFEGDANKLTIVCILQNVVWPVTQSKIKVTYTTHS